MVPAPNAVNSATGGTDPAISADGRLLAYTAPCLGGSVFLRNVDSGAGNGWTVHLPAGVPTAHVPGVPGAQVTHLAWAPDGVHLAVSVRGANWQGVEILDTSQPPSATKTRLVGPPPPTSPGESVAGWADATWTSPRHGSQLGGQLVVLAPRCAPYMDCVTGGWRALAVDPGTGRSTLLAGEGAGGTTPTALAADPAGGSFVAVAGSKVVRLAGGRPPAVVVGGAAAVGWVTGPLAGTPGGSGH
ncbi:MAG: hypothetical protein ACRD0L_15230 [Acidimicrobiales bacterium]